MNRLVVVLHVKGALGMYCRHCGKVVTEVADFCTSCGVSVKKGGSFCRSCGAEVSPEADVCVKCGEKVRNTTQEPKSKVVAGLLGIFLGVFGIHRFYLGYTTIGLVQLLLSLLGGIFTCGIASAVVSIWGFIEGILILCNQVITTDADGNELE